MAVPRFTLTPRPRVGLLGKFAIASLLLIVLLGLALAQALRGEIRQRALLDARRTASVLERSLIQPELDGANLNARLTPAQVATLDHALRGSLDGREIASVKIWSARNEVIYANDHAIIGKRFARSEELEQAFGGSTASEVSDLQAAENATDRSFGRLLEVYTPLQQTHGGAVPAAFELYMPYKPIEAAIAHDTRELTVILLAGLALLYLVLYRIVASASTRLRRQANDLRRKAEENEHLALHDVLTGLPNRSLFHDRTSQAILATARIPSTVGLMVLDLDRFKEINDTLGHHNGDLLLKEVGRRLSLQLRDGDTVARLGGDEFGLLLPRISDEDAALAIAEKVRQALHDPVVLEGIALDLDASIGVALYPDHGTTSRRCCSAPTSPCTSPSTTTPAASSTQRPATSTAQRGSHSSGSCARRSMPASWCCTTSRRPTSRPVTSPASKRSCAGSTRSTACSNRTSSFPWPSELG